MLLADLMLEEREIMKGICDHMFLWFPRWVISFIWESNSQNGAAIVYNGAHMWSSSNYERTWHFLTTIQTRCVAVSQQYISHNAPQYTWVLSAVEIVSFSGRSYAEESQSDSVGQQKHGNKLFRCSYYNRFPSNRTAKIGEYDANSLEWFINDLRTNEKNILFYQYTSKCTRV